jgi:hypothetical protein
MSQSQTGPVETARGASGSDNLESLLARINSMAVEKGVGPIASTSSTAAATAPPPPTAPPRESPHAPSPPIAPPAVAAANREGVLPPVTVAAADHSINGSGTAVQADGKKQPWFPTEPTDLASAGISEGQLEHLLLKSLNACGDLSGWGLSEQQALPFRLVEPVLQDLKTAQLVALRGSAAMGDYIYQLTDLGRERAKKLAENCTYFGAAPVTLPAYIKSVAAQTLTAVHPTVADLENAFSDLLINPSIMRRLGPAVNSGRGLFLYGQPGNGKTSIAERVTKAFGDAIWMPRAIAVDGEIIRVFDPGLHEEIPDQERGQSIQNKMAIDRRWVRVKRPTIVVGGELTMETLEISQSGIGISEAPVQLKSNCGTLVIDDFGRQRMSTDELLNRWIVPLEKRYDFLRLANGKKIQVPFDQLIVFSTNLEPKDLVDDAFLRRIPYKIEVPDPTEEEFRKLFHIMAPKLKLTCDDAVLDYLVTEHYHGAGRPFRCCQPRDLLQQVVNYCHYIDAQPVMSREYIDYAVENYFAIM